MSNVLVFTILSYSAEVCNIIYLLSEVIINFKAMDSKTSDTKESRNANSVNYNVNGDCIIYNITISENKNNRRTQKDDGCSSA